MTDELITAEIMAFYGKGGIPGVTIASCESLCEATAQLDDAHPDAICRAFAFKRAAPFSYVDKTGWCYLLKSAGACKIEDFGVELYTRQIESERQCSATAPGLDSKCLPSNHRSQVANFTFMPPSWQIRCAWGSPVPGTMRGCSRTPTLRPWPRRCPTSTTRRLARVGYRCRARSWRPCP